jgi:hypothetical protein
MKQNDERMLNVNFSDAVQNSATLLQISVNYQFCFINLAALQKLEIFYDSAVLEINNEKWAVKILNRINELIAELNIKL